MDVAWQHQLLFCCNASDWYSLKILYSDHFCQSSNLFPNWKADYSQPYHHDFHPSENSYRNEAQFFALYSSSLLSQFLKISRRIYFQHDDIFRVPSLILCVRKRPEINLEIFEICIKYGPDIWYILIGQNLHNKWAILCYKGRISVIEINFLSPVIRKKCLNVNVFGGKIDNNMSFEIIFWTNCSIRFYWFFPDLLSDVNWIIYNPFNRLEFPCKSKMVLDGIKIFVKSYNLSSTLK